MTDHTENDNKGVYVFNYINDYFGHPCAVFDQLNIAVCWICKNKVSGMLTRYPMNVSIYDWAIANHFFVPKRPDQFQPEFIGRFTSAYLEHYHFEFDDDGNITYGEDVINEHCWSYPHHAPSDCPNHTDYLKKKMRNE